MLTTTYHSLNRQKNPVLGGVCSTTNNITVSETNEYLLAISQKALHTNTIIKFTKYKPQLPSFQVTLVNRTSIHISKNIT